MICQIGALFGGHPVAGQKRYKTGRAFRERSLDLCEAQLMIISHSIIFIKM